jgi:hypothetical protein
MRNKWLDWTPETGSVGFDGSTSVVLPITRVSERNGTPVPGLSLHAIMERVAASEPTKPTEPTSADQGEPPVEKPSYFWGKRGGTYGWRAHAALDAICEIPAPKGFIVWLGEHSPFLYGKLTRDLPNEISRAWDAQVPYEDFDALCRELVDTYRRGVALYRG